MDAPGSTTWNTADLLGETRWMRALARRLAQGTAEEDDALQDAFVAALEREPRSDRSLRPWLARVLRNRIALARRGAARRWAREREAAAAEALPATDEMLERAELHARVVRALTELREPQRGVLLERFFGELSPAAIARRRGVPAATVRSWIHRGLRELRAELDRSFGDDRERCGWALLALARPAHVAPPLVRPTLLESLKTMTPANPLLLAATALVVAGGLYRLGTDSPPGLAGPLPSSASAAPLEPAGPSPSPRLAFGPPETTSPASQDEAPVKGTLRDPGGHPLREFALELRHAGAEDDAAWSDPELVVTDGEGHFATLGAYPAGKLRYRLIDHADLRSVARFARQFLEWREGVMGSSTGWSPTQGPITVTALVGPTFEVQLTGLGDLAPDALTGSLEPAEDEPWGPLPSAWTALAPVRAGDPAWIRFAWRLRGTSDDGRPWRLSIEGAQGTVAGEALVQWEENAASTPVAIALAPTARLEVTLTVSDALADPAVILEADPGGARRPLLPVAVEDLGDGRREVRFARGGLAPGTYRVLVSVDDVDQLADTVTLAAGEAISRAIDLGGATATTVLAGELRSASGTYHGRTFLRVSDSAGATLHYAPAEWVEQDGQWVAPFVIGNLPPSACELSLEALASYRRWSGLPVHAVPPANGLVLVCDDQEPVRELDVRVVDASTGERIQKGWSTITLQGCERSQTMVAGGGWTLFRGVPLGALTEWYAAADGYVPRWGGSDVLVEEGERLVAEVALVAGWGARIRAVRAGTIPAEPLEGVTLLLDGQPAGSTNAAGELVLTRPAAPGHISVALAGWTYVGGDLDAGTGRLEPYRPWAVLRFAP